MGEWKEGKGGNSKKMNHGLRINTKMITKTAVLLGGLKMFQLKATLLRETTRKRKGGDVGI